VKKHLQRAYRKLGVESRIEALLLLVEGFPSGEESKTEALGTAHASGRPGSALAATTRFAAISGSRIP
jgi:hypothetical protein